LLGLTFLGLAMGGMSLFAVAKPMMTEVWHDIYINCIRLSKLYVYILTGV
jgi:hypothetical protein